MIARAWFLLLAAKDFPIEIRAVSSRSFFALPCTTLEDLAEQMAMHRHTRRLQAN